ncbi:MAG: hypothetical protein K8S99_13465 [Planctomycetes bacterium]|nr:hypothetical protein [Planctomycetota bacterium]
MATTDTRNPSRDGHGRGVIELKLRNVRQLFNSMDPSPFPEKDLDADAEEFIVSWARELPRHAPLVLLVYLTDSPAEGDPARIIEEGVRTYFAHRREMAHHRLRQLLGRGRGSLVIGLLFVAACVGVADVIGAMSKTTLTDIVRESLLIGGWVAMWRPMEIFLYDWWPIRAEMTIYQRLSTADVRVVLHA